MNDSERAASDVADWLAGQEPAMAELLGRIVNIDSGSHDKPGIDRVVATLDEFLASHGISTDTLPQERNGNILRARIGPRANTGAVLLSGHCDTVFPKGEASRRPFTIRDGRAYGPGVADMKAGLVMNCFVLAALARRDDLAVPVAGLFTGDEEIGSPASKDIIRAEARGARAVFNAEPGRPGGEVVTGRRACLFVHLKINGRAAHSGANIQAGRSALQELSEKIIRLHALTDMNRNISVNVGLASGGQSANTVAPDANAVFDVRYPDPSDRAPLMQEIESILQTSYVPDTSTEYVVKGEFPPFAQSEGSRDLFETYRAGAQSEGVDIQGVYTLGAADSGFAAETGAATLCGTGPVGGNYHSPDEYIEMPSLLQRASILGRTIITMTA